MRQLAPLCAPGAWQAARSVEVVRRGAEFAWTCTQPVCEGTRVSRSSDLTITYICSPHLPTVKLCMTETLTCRGSRYLIRTLDVFNDGIVSNLIGAVGFTTCLPGRHSLTSMLFPRGLGETNPLHTLLWKQLHSSVRSVRALTWCYTPATPVPLR